MIEAGTALALFGTSSVNINNGARDVGALRYAGTVTVDGVAYYSYESAAAFDAPAPTARLDAAVSPFQLQSAGLAAIGIDLA